MSRMVPHGRIELALAGVEGKLRETVLEMLRVHSEQGHGGGSAGIFRGLFRAALKEDDPRSRLQEIRVEEDPLGPDGVVELLDVLDQAALPGDQRETAAEYFLTLAARNPITPLQGTDEEWEDTFNDGEGPSDEPLWQNKRCCRVFKDKDGNAFDVDGKVFRAPDGSCWTNSAKSAVPVEFPYIPATEIVDVPA